MTDRAKNLHRLLTMIKDVELTRLSQLSAQQRVAQADVARLQSARDSRAQDIAILSEPDAAMSASSDQKWQLWAEDEAARLEAIAAEISCRHGEQRALARKAFGRMQAFDAMTDSLARPRRD